MGFSQIEEKMQNHHHHCHQCGWGYPKPHPSAKQRRAHKKVCGKQQHESQGNGGGGGVGGYQEDDNVNEKKKMRVSGGGGLFGRQVSSKSEEDEYSDTFTDFLVDSDLQPSNAGGNMQPPESPSADSSPRTPEVSNSAVFQLGTFTETQNHSSSFTMDFAAEEPSTLGLTKQANSSPTEVSEDVHVEDTETCKKKNCLPDIVKDVDAVGKNDSNENLSAIQPLLSKSASEVSDVVVTSQMLDGFARDNISPDISNTDVVNLPMHSVMNSKEMETDTVEQKLSVNESRNNSNGKLPTTHTSPSDSASEESMVVDTPQTLDGSTSVGTVSDITDCSDMDADALPMEKVVETKEVETDNLEQKLSPDELKSISNGNPLEIQTLLTKSVGKGSDVVGTSPKEVETDNLEQKTSPDELKSISNGNPSAIQALLTESVGEESDVVGTSPKLDGPARNIIFSDVNDMKYAHAVTSPVDSIEDWKETDTNNREKKMFQNEMGESKDVCGPEAAFQVEVNCANRSYVDHCDNSNDGCTVKKVSENLPEEMVKDSEENIPVKSRVSPTTNCGEEMTEMNIQNTEDACTGFQPSEIDDSVNLSPLERGVLEGNRQQEVVSSKRLVKEVSIEQEAYVSDAKDVNETLELHEPEALRYYAALDRAFSDMETSQMDPHFSEQVVSFMSIPETIDAVTEKDDGLHKEDMKDITEKDGNFGVGAIDESSIQRNIESEASSSPIELKDNSEETKGSSAMIMDASQFENAEESPSDSQDCHGENYHRNPKELDSVETSVDEQEEFVGGDDKIEEPLQKERKFDCSIETETFQKVANDTTVEESKSSAVNSVPCVLNSSSLEDGVKVLGLKDASDAFTHCSEDEKSSLETQLKAMAVVLLDSSVGSVSQADSVDGSWGSVSDGTVPSSKSAMNSSSVSAAGETQIGTDSQPPKEVTVSSRRNNHQIPSEIRAIQNLQQSHSTSLQASTNQSRDGKKNKEEMIEKVENWNNTPIRAPLKSFLFEPIFESTAETGFQGHTKSPTYEDGATSSTSQAETASPTRGGHEVTTNTNNGGGLKRNIDKEWNSPARLPSSRSQKRKLRWAPFFCCSPVVN